MSVAKKIKFSSNNLADILVGNYFEIVKEFYEMQTNYLASRYKLHRSIETTTIIQCFIKSVHLTIIRQRERNLDYNVSLNSFIKNLKEIKVPSHKIVSIVNTTGIPKETVRRKIKILTEKKIIFEGKNREYFWHLNNEEREVDFMKIMKKDINMMSKFICGNT
jgi:hypothetical protein